MTKRLFKSVSLIDAINHGYEDGFKLRGSRTPQCVRILSRHHKNIMHEKYRDKYFCMGIMRFREDGSFNGFGCSNKNKRLVY